MRISKLMMPAVTLAGALALAGCGGGGGTATTTEGDEGSTVEYPVPSAGIRIGNSLYQCAAGVDECSLTVNADGSIETPDPEEVTVTAVTPITPRTPQDIAAAACVAGGDAWDGTECVDLDDLESAAEQRGKDARDAKRVHAALHGDNFEAVTSPTNANPTFGTYTTSDVENADADGTRDVKWPDKYKETLKAIGQSFGGTGNTANFQTVDNDDADANYEKHVYTTQGTAKTPLFFDSETYTEVSGGPNNGRHLIVTANHAHITDVAEFPQTVQAGQKDFDNGTGQTGFRGKLQGAAGVYICATGCNATKAATGYELGGTWHFDPDDGARVTEPDLAYQSFGWWSKTANDGKVVYRHVYSATTGLETPRTDLADTNFSGTAKYKGGAAGHYAINNAQVPANNQAGEFTADVELQARWDTGDGHAKVSGMIDGFETDGDVGDTWEVRLMENGGNHTGGYYAGEVRWTMNGVTDTQDGGNYRMATYGGGTDSPPVEMGGTFQAEHTGTARMAGAFAATAPK